ncbi:dynein regulatory complex protein 9-like [Leptidea sinapis]|uniref:dynein regulatory complex protein 9-like n=1 Tax=Leptidea sinapis TaxID=189913 RepID=UPI0021C4B506|nr:dynein regulatory complex protein 9-like [Leptidea sinapis]
MSVRLNYAEKWLTARMESLELQNRKEKTPVPRLDDEERAHLQVIKIYENHIKERMDSSHYWQTRYINDIADIIGKVRDISEKWKEVVARRTELQKLYELHEGEMRGWLTFKRERVARLAREEQNRVAATRLQSWWRGVMVRRCLGAFRNLKNTKKINCKSKKK